MPKAKSKPAPVQPVVPTPPPPPEPELIVPPSTSKLPLLYDTLEITEYSTTSKRGPLTIEDMKLLLGWETEKEFQARKVKEYPDSKPDAWLYGDTFHVKNTAGEKVRCVNNGHNRPFDEEWAKSLMDTILYGRWAGPFTIPGGTVNGETIRISRYGEVLSGQHTMTGCILAGEKLAEARADNTDHPNDPKYPIWRERGEPFVETIVITGMSSDPRVLMTVDYVKPRTAADVFYTSEVFREATVPDRKELCRNLAVASDFLWTRTHARGYRTHPEMVGFLERHKWLLDCTMHLFNMNNQEAGRKISKHRLSPGQCAAIMFIQGSSGPKTDGDFYRNESPPTEKNLDWSLWDKAEEFWTLLADGKDFLPVRMALGRLVDSTPANTTNQGLGGRGPEKLATLANAWERWRDHTGGQIFDNDDLASGGILSLNYTDLDDTGKRLPDGQVKLIEVADFYGIDCPEVVTKRANLSSSTPPEPPPPTGEEYERLKEEARARRK